MNYEDVLLTLLKDSLSSQECDEPDFGEAFAMEGNGIAVPPAIYAPELGKWDVF
jgi:hypothetical protein